MRKHDSAKEIGKRIKEVRIKLRLQQKEMAGTLKIAPSYLCEIENGNSNPGPELFVRLASEYKVNLNFLFIGYGDLFIDAPWKMKMQEFDLDEEVDSLDKLFWLLDKSMFLRGALLSHANKLLFEDKEIIRHSLQKKKAKTGENSE